ncbi:hypothetical protein [Mangrovimonas cancribranchiae]|uniref:Uncharacterized protein n=1 Tax=Mangrovimonas cancribranchiae TaxID=3080055 RepID=A0AAU6PBE7_9FLAO
MEEFLRQNYVLLVRSVEMLAAIIGVFCLKKYKHTTAKYFIYIVIYWVLVDRLGGYVIDINNYKWLHFIKPKIEGTWFEKNHWWYSIFSFFFARLFFILYFLKILKNKYFKQVIKVLTISYVITYLTYYAIHFESLFLYFTHISLKIFGAAIIFLCCIFYFIEVLLSDKILNFYKSLNFYIAAVLFIWELIITPMSFYNVYFTTADWNFVVLKWQIYLGAIMFMYLTFSFALLWCKPQND